MTGRICAWALVLSPLLTGSARAQQPPATPPGVPAAAINPAKPDDVTQVTQGWLLLSQGSAAAAADRARDVLSRSPYSPAASALAIEADIARGGSAAGLTEYERLLGARAFEEPLLLRRIGQALLREAAAQTADYRSRLTALRALSAAGDAAATGELSAAMATGNDSAARLLAETGNPEAIKRLIDGMNTRIVDPVSALASLSKTRNTPTVTLAIELLDDPRSEVRGAAIDALAKMRAREAAPKLRALLKDDRPFIRIGAASALLAMGDETGLPLIQELTTSESPEARLDAAEALSDRKDAAWVEMVRKLTSAPEPEVRVRAARLIAGMDPQLAESVLAGIRADPNPAVRSLAAGVALEEASSDLRALRRLMHSSSLEQRVLAAERVLAVSR
jgi:HEAT repeat protein